MKFLCAVTILFCAPTFATVASTAAVAPSAWLSTEVVNCQSGNESVSIQILSPAQGDTRLAVATFIDYKRNGVSIYSTTQYQKPRFVPAGAGGYTIEGYAAEAGKVLSLYQDYMTYVVRLDAPGKSGFFFQNCMSNGAIATFTNLGTPVIEPVPAKRKSPPKRKDFYHKI